MINKNFNEIILHCSATPEGKDFNAQWIRNIHIKENGWLDIGYHKVIKLDGTVEEGRDISKIGAHCADNCKNKTSLGIVYVGGCDKNMNPKDTRTDKQKQSIEKLIRQLVKEYPQLKYLSGHNNYANKACPSFDVSKEYAYLSDVIKVGKN